MRIEVVEILEGGYVVIVVAHHDRTAQTADDFQTFVGTGVVADHIAGAEVISDPLLATVRKDGLQSVKVGVNVAQNCQKLSHLL